MTKHKSSDELYNLTKSFIDKYNKLPSSSSIYNYEKRLGSWCYQMRKKYKENKLSKEQINKLKLLKIWYWNKQDFNEQKYKQLVKNKNFNIKLGDKKLKNWVKNNNIAHKTFNIINKKIILHMD